MDKVPTSIRLRKIFFKIIEKYPIQKECSLVLCYHSISKDGWIFSVTEKDFESHLKILLKTKNIISLKKLLGEKDKLNGKSVAITFDDGYETVFTAAYPVLKKYGLTACVFVNSVGNNGGKVENYNGRKPLNLKQIRLLKKEGWEIGYHTKSHRNLRFLSEKEIENELIYGKKELEKKLSFKINYFSYPYGIYNKIIVDIVKNAGYKYSFTADGGKIDFQESPFKISRILIDKYINSKELRVLTSYRGLLFNKFLTLCLRLKDDCFLGYKLLKN